MGEGVGAIMLKRVADAEQEGELLAEIFFPIEGAAPRAALSKPGMAVRPFAR